MSRIFNKNLNTKLYQDKNNFLKIVEFYLFETPIDTSSKRSITFKTYGWIYGHRYKELKTTLFNNESNSIINFFCENAGNRKQLKIKFKENAIIKSNNEFCFYYKVDEGSEIRSLFQIIRNSLAHGEFVIRQFKKETMYYFENYSKKGNKNAEIYLNEKTLLEWINIIKGGPSK